MNSIIILILLLIFLVRGYSNSFYKLDLTKYISAILLNGLIPLSIIYYLAIAHQEDLLLIATIPVFLLFLWVIFRIVLLIVSRYPYEVASSYLLDPNYGILARDRILTTIGPNLGWFGIAAALALFGEKGALLFVGIYIGNSLLYNFELALANRGVLNIIIAIIKTPTFIALVIGIALMPYASYIEEKFADYIGYLITVVGCFGMFIIGSLIDGVKWNKDLFIQESHIFFTKLIICGLMIFFIYDINIFPNQAWLLDNVEIIFLIALLPYATGTSNNNFLKSSPAIIPVNNNSLIAYGTLIPLFWIAIYAIFLNLVK